METNSGVTPLRRFNALCISRTVSGVGQPNAYIRCVQRHFRETGNKRRKTMTNKNSNWKLNVFAIAAAVAASVVPASAQDVRLKATIPFAFSVNKNVNLAAGSYVVSREGNVWRFRNEETFQSVAIVNYSGHEGQAAERPSLNFECVDAHCQLRAIRTGGGELGAEVPAPKLSISDKAELASVSVPLQQIRGN
jgi:hypothetical protein